MGSKIHFNSIGEDSRKFEKNNFSFGALRNKNSFANNQNSEIKDYQLSNNSELKSSNKKGKITQIKTIKHSNKKQSSENFVQKRKAIMNQNNLYEKYKINESVFHNNIGIKPHLITFQNPS